MSRERVQKSLDVAAHRDVSVRDVFRICYTYGKCRPVIAKLNSVELGQTYRFERLLEAFQK